MKDASNNLRLTMSVHYVSAIALALASASTAAPAHSAERAELVSCAAEVNSVKRLACFESLTTKYDAAPSSRTTTTAGAGKWNTSTDTDPMTDKAVHYAILTSDSGRARFGNSVTLIVRCRDNKTEMYINWNDFLGMDSTNTTYRVGKQAARSNRWSVSTDKKAGFFPGSPISVLREISTSDSFVANVTPYNESPITAVFDTTGAEVAFADIRKGCGW